ncbi:hypothetical protein C1646_763359 [Rhizophagus diaphanus]|nr:hypothetical protein C1646_763359 [Rhizophagus diaphanus] [Rhizophagus sp. MUCL 43196]
MTPLFGKIVSIPILLFNYIVNYSTLRDIHSFDYTRTENQKEEKNNKEEVRTDVETENKNEKMEKDVDLKELEEGSEKD